MSNKQKWSLPKDDVRVAVSYEGGQDGFSIYRALRSRRMDCYVIDTASISVKWHRRCAKTDRPEQQRNNSSLAQPQRPEARRDNIDDWVFKRGHRYGTLPVSFEQRRPSDLLPDRDATERANRKPRDPNRIARSRWC
ncbi:MULTISPECIES: hypothetical protein [Mycetohabitans]|uniref:hypothetical protein n=1 Tax=Mycetohabitans TaxID=2571159 RepID=UPI001E2F2709|nr:MULTISPECIES: hypothetical protein [Mycetohabitans]